MNERAGLYKHARAHAQDGVNTSCKNGTVSALWWLTLHGIDLPRSSVMKPLIQFDRQPTKADFTFEKRISAGNYGAVHLAKHTETGTVVAIKVLKKDKMGNKNEVQQVMAERDILQYAQNPFLVNLICSFTTKDSL